MKLSLSAEVRVMESSLGRSPAGRASGAVWLAATDDEMTERHRVGMP